MSWLDTLLGNIGQARSVLSDQTGGAEAPSTTPPAAAAATPAAPANGLAALAGLPKSQQHVLQQIASMPPAAKARLQALHDALLGAGQTQEHAPAAGGALAGAAAKFGGQVLGYGARPEAAPGASTDRFASVLKDGDLYHIYADAHQNQKMRDGAVAAALGIKPKMGALEVYHPSATPHSSRAGAHVDPATGGVRAPRLPIR